ncbi:MAG: hypothetical protein B6241_09235 [Spirochaetaceae bacterium 4572_59]|nr:MAG: hypothetical protein B6241_09235 [Spirochaetaceae bacterium 4572_59]
MNSLLIENLKKSYRIIFLLFFSITNVMGENLIFDQLTMQDGLVNNAVSGIIQDDQGYLWFGTQNGLTRYDGKSFKIFDHDPFDCNSLPHNQIQTIYQDPVDPYLWIGTYEGLSRFNLETWDFKNFTSDPELNRLPLSNGIVTSVIRDAEGLIWAGTLEGLNRIDPESGEIRVYHHSDEDQSSLLHNTVRALELDDRERLWVGSYGGLDLYDSASDSFIHFKADRNKPEAINSPYVMALRKGGEGFLWVGTWDGDISLFDTVNEKTVSHISVPGNVYVLYPEYECSLWIGTWGDGLCRWNSLNKELEHYSNDPDDPYKLNNGIIYSFLRDRSGLLWIGTNGGGVNLLNPNKKDFRFLYHKKGEERSLPVDNIIKIVEDRSADLWVGTYSNGLWRFPGENSDSALHNWLPEEDNPFSLSHKNVHVILEDSRGALWIGSLGGLDRFNTETEDFDHYPLIGAGLDDSLEPLIYDMVEDSDGTFWIGTYSKGVLHWSEEEGILGTYSYAHENATLSNNLVMDLFIDSHDDLWAGTNRGLNRFNRKTGEFESFYHSIDNRKTLSSNYISVIFEDSSQNLWIGTDGGGLNLYDRASNSFTYYSREDGLGSNHIQAILEDDRQRLWIGSINGMNILNPESGDILAIDSSDGIMASEMNKGSFKGADGSLYFSCREGILRFEQSILHDNDIPPQLWFNDIHVMEESIPFLEYVNERKVLTLPWDRNYLSFEFIALDFTSPERNLYRYKMEGLDREWVSSGNRNFASYSNLKPGAYTFKVMGSNNDGFWNTENLSFSIKILPPPWKQKWFILLYIALGVLLFILVSNLQANLLLKRKLKTAESSKMKLEVLNNRLEELAWKDSLTGLGNRRFFDLSINNMWHLAVREKKHLSLLMIDVDFFKAYNDFYGHQMGDEALRKTAEIIRSILRRDTDAVCRYGGEEFTVLLFDMELKEAYALCEALLSKMRSADISHEASSAAPYLTISIGLTGLVPDFDQDPDMLVLLADKALYKAKGHGRNRIEYCNPAELEED